MSDVYIYQCGSCSTRYANLPGMSIRCPECRSKERELILSESTLDLANRFIRLNVDKAILMEAAKGANQAFRELDTYAMGVDGIYENAHQKLKTAIEIVEA